MVTNKGSEMLQSIPDNLMSYIPSDLEIENEGNMSEFSEIFRVNFSNYSFIL